MAEAGTAGTTATVGVARGPLPSTAARTPAAGARELRNWDAKASVGRTRTSGSSSGGVPYDASGTGAGAAARDGAGALEAGAHNVISSYSQVSRRASRGLSLLRRVLVTRSVRYRCTSGSRPRLLVPTELVKPVFEILLRNTRTHAKWARVRLWASIHRIAGYW